MTQSSAERPRILVVDDLEANLLVMEGLLRSMPCEIVLVSSGNDALRELLKHDFAMMLLDVQMPGMDGYEVASHARLNPSTAGVPIIFVTATHESEASELRGYDSGAVDYLFKPVNPAVLRSKVRVFLELFESRKKIADGLQALTVAYDEIRETQAQLIEAAKLASIGQLVAGIAHEINNPLAFSLSHLSVAKRDLERVDASVGKAIEEAVAEPWQRARQRIGSMALGLERIQDLVLKLRTFSRLDEGERKTISVREGLESIVTILRHRMGDRISFETQLCDHDQIECHPALLNQALMNLVSNAIDAIEGNGAIKVMSEVNSDNFRIVIADTGSGIPKEIRDKIFDPFFTTKPVGQGTGLGLSITDSIVRRHGGTLEVLDNEGGGTRMVISLPLAT